MTMRWREPSRRPARRVGDPVWRMPLWTAYESWLDSQVADMNNVAEGAFAGSIIGAIFLRRFVKPRPAFCPFRYLWLAAGG